MRRRPKTDGNQAEIVSAMRDAGATVTITAALGGGYPDLHVGYRGLSVQMEVKLPQSDFVKGGTGGKRARRADEYDPRDGFTPDEIAYHDAWRGQPIVTVRSVDDALQAIGVK